MEHTSNPITPDKLYFRLEHEKLLNGPELVLSCLREMDEFRQTWLPIDRLVPPIELSSSCPCLIFMGTRFRLLEYLLENASLQIAAPRCNQLGIAVWTGLKTGLAKRVFTRFLPTTKKQKNLGYIALDRGTGVDPKTGMAKTTVGGGMLSNIKEQKKLFKQHQGDTWTCLTIYAVDEIDQNEQAKAQDGVYAAHVLANHVSFGGLCGLLRTNGLGLNEKKLGKLDKLEAAIEKEKANKNQKEKKV